MSYPAENPLPDVPAVGLALNDAAVDGPFFAPMPEGLTLLAFSLGDEWYSVDSAHVRGIEPETDVTPVPRAPQWLVGVFNLRGTILPIVDPRPLLSLPSRGTHGKKGLLVVYHCDGIAAALQVDTVDEIYEVARSSLEPALGAGHLGRTELILGQVRVRDRLIGVLDLQALLRALLEG